LITKKNTLILPFLFILLLLIGCDIIGPEFIKPDAPVDNEWLEVGDSKISTGKADFSEWW